MLMDVRNVLRQSTVKQSRNTCTMPTVTDSPSLLRFGSKKYGVTAESHGISI